MKQVRLYSVGKFYEETYAIPCKDVKDIEEARNIILSMRREWQETYTDEEYLKKFGKNKVVIYHEETCYIRYVGRWVCEGYEYKEWDWEMTWEKTNKIGRGAMECYVFFVENKYKEFDIYCRENEKKLRDLEEFF